MSSFTAPIRAEDSSDGKLRTLLESFDFFVGVDQALFEITVPKGFTTDGASIPRVFHSIASPWTGHYAKAAVLHDYLYKKALVSRFMADAIFLEAMLVAGTRPIKAKIMYFGVRLFGWYAWNKHRSINTNKGK